MSQEFVMSQTPFTARRRSVLYGTGLGAAAAALAACTTYGKPPAAESPPASAAPAEASPGTPTALTKTADVPVGSGVIVDDVVVTQPTGGDFKGFSAVCPHAGCNVNEVVDGAIVCPCHGSRFNLDGTVAKGPAKEPLTSTPITVEGDAIFKG